MIRSVLGGLALAAITLLGYWRVFEKAGVAGWKALVPVYHTYVLLGMVGRPGWWLALTFVPVVNIGVAAVLAMDLAECFGERLGFAFGLVLLPVVFVPMLGFGDASYRRIR